MEKNKKPIDNIKEDIQDIIVKINKLQDDFKELEQVSIDIKNLIAEHLFKPEIIVEPRLKGWFY
tara:strand:+ start:564 stop:755 length:192 start_codon:yes stop_codon:yes gene_type:complete